MYISSPVATAILLFGSSVGITALTRDSVSANLRSLSANAAAIESRSNKRHDLSLSLGNPPAALVPRL